MKFRMKRGWTSLVSSPLTFNFFLLARCENCLTLDFGKSITASTTSTYLWIHFMVTCVLIHWHSDLDLILHLETIHVSCMKSLWFPSTFFPSPPRTLFEVLYAISSKHSLVIMAVVVPIYIQTTSILFKISEIFLNLQRCKDNWESSVLQTWWEVLFPDWECKSTLKIDWDCCKPKGLAVWFSEILNSG